MANRKRQNRRYLGPAGYDAIVGEAVSRVFKRQSPAKLAALDKSMAAFPGMINEWNNILRGEKQPKRGARGRYPSTNQVDRKAGPGSRTLLRSAKVIGLRRVRGGNPRTFPFDPATVGPRAKQYSASIRLGEIEAAGDRARKSAIKRAGRNTGSFKDRAGSWKKGKGGRFVGSS